MGYGLDAGLNWVNLPFRRLRGDRLDERYRLMAEVQYGGGLRLKALARLRVKDVDLGRRQITIRQGKGDLDRVTVRPEALVAAWRFLGRWGR